MTKLFDSISFLHPASVSFQPSGSYQKRALNNSFKFTSVFWIQPAGLLFIIDLLFMILIFDFRRNKARIGAANKTLCEVRVWRNNTIDRRYKCGIHPSMVQKATLPLSRSYWSVLLALSPPTSDGELNKWICPGISRHLLSLNPLLACCRRYSRGER